MSRAEKIYFQLKEAIERGEYPPGSQLPSLRDQADIFACNKLTVKKAYDLLKEEGLIENSVGRGSFVTFPRETGEEAAAASAFSFRTASVHEDFFPIDEVEQVSSRLFQRYGSKLFAAAPPGGNPGCREAFSRFYRVPAEGMLIISGAQQGLDLTGRLFSHRGKDALLFEDPTYSGAINLFRPTNFVPLTEDGPDLERLEAAAREGIAAFYSMPGVHNPTGISYSPGVMEAITELSRRYDFYIIEDDYLSELKPTFPSGQQPRFVDMAPERSIYIKSLSKITAPGLRIGFLIAPEPLREELLYNKFTADVGTGSFIQYLMMGMIEEGLLAKNIDRVNAVCRKRRETMEELLSRFPFLSFIPRRWGYNIWVDSSIDPDIPAAPWALGKSFSFDPRCRNRFRLSFMGIGEDRFPAALSYLEALFTEMGERAGSSGSGGVL
jgi:2-aminoadipate transaminase